MDNFAEEFKKAQLNSKSGRRSIFEVNTQEADRETPLMIRRGMYEVKYSPERMSLLERVKEKRKQRSMYRVSQSKHDVANPNNRSMVMPHLGQNAAEMAINLPEIRI